MFLWPIIQTCVLVLVSLVTLTQVIIPAFTGKRLFWFFKKSESDLLEAQRTISDLNIDKKVQDIREEIKKKNRDLN